MFRKNYIDFIEDNNLTYTSAVFELTRCCNFQCKMCCVRKNTEKITDASDFVKIAEDACNNGLIDLTLTGGEIFLRNDFFDIYNPIYDMGIIISLMTNGYLLDDYKISELKKRPPRIVHITLYGASNKTYENVCGCKNGFNIVYANILKLKKVGINIVIQVTITKLNVNDYEDILKIADDLGIPVRISYRIFDPVRDADTNISDVENIRLDLLNLPSKLENILGWKKETVMYIKKCNAIKNSFCVTSDRKLQICQNSEFPNVDIKKYGLNDSLILLKKQLENFKIPEVCIHCENLNFCDLCYSGIYKNSQGEFVPYNYFCELAEINRLIFQKKLKK